MRERALEKSPGMVGEYTVGLTDVPDYGRTFAQSIQSFGQLYGGFREHLKDLGKSITCTSW